MAIAHRASGTQLSGNAGTTTVTIGLPTSGVVVGDLRLVGRTVKPSSATTIAESGWGLAGEATGGTGASALDAGATRGRVDYREVASGDPTSVTFDQGNTPNAVAGVAVAYSKSASQVWSVGSISGDDTTHATGRSATASGSVVGRVGDMIVAFVHSDTDATTAYTSPAITVPGFNIATTTIRVNAGGVSQNNDAGIAVVEGLITGGPAGDWSMTPSISLSGGPSNCGPVIFVFIGERPLPDLVPQDLAHAHTTENVTITTGPGIPTLAPSDTSHAHTTDAVTVTIATDIGSSTAAAAGSLAGVAPGKIQVGDPVLAHVVHTSASLGVTPPTGWTLVAESNPADFTSYLYELNNPWTGSEALTWTLVGGTANMAIDLYRIPGYEIDAVGTVANVAATNTVTPGVTPLTNNTDVVAFGSVDATGGARTWTVTEGGEVFEQSDNDLHRVIARRTISGGLGANQNTSLVISGSTQDMAGIAVSLKLLPSGVDLAPADTAHAHTTDAVVITQTHVLAPVDTAHANTADAVVVTQIHVLAPLDTAHAHTTDAVVVTQIQRLTVSDTDHAHTTDAVTITQTHVLAPADTSHAHTTDAVTVTQVHNLTPTDTEHAHTTEAVAISQVQLLVVSDTEHAHTTENVTIDQALALVVADTAHEHTTESVTVTQTHQLAAADTEHAHTTEAVAITQAHALVVADTDHAHTTDSVSITQAHVLAAADTEHAHTTEAVVISQAHVLAPADTEHSHTTDAVTISQVQILAVDDTSHEHTTENVALTGQGTLNPAESEHAHTTESVTLSQIHQLVATDTEHGHTTEAVTISLVVTLAPADTSHAHTTENVSIDQETQLAPSDASHGHTTDNVTLTQVHVLVPSDTSHGHTTENVTLGVFGEDTLNPADTAHGHTTEELVLVQVHQLVVDDTSHGHTTETVVLETDSNLIVADSSHAHTSGTVTLTQIHWLVVADTSHRHTTDAVSLGKPIPDFVEFTYVVPAETRTMVVEAEDRTYVVGAEDRTLVIEAEDRTYIVPAGARTLEAV
jgi:hypothetical protein